MPQNNPKKSYFFTLFAIFCIVFSTFSKTLPLSEWYSSFDFGAFEKPEFDVFSRGIEGYYALVNQEKLSEKGILTLIDFRKSSNEKRLWVLDLKNNRALYYSLVAHGRNTGELFARSFSNKPNSNQSSLGFYATGKTYYGKHGLSLKLHGLEPGINDKAEQRAIVMHGADYVSQEFVTRAGRLGRSFGCPAIPMSLRDKLIPQIASGTCLFIFYPDDQYLGNTQLVNRGRARDPF